MAAPFPWAIVDELYNGQPLYTETGVQELFRVVGPPTDPEGKAEATAFKLSELGKTFAFNLWYEAQPNITDQDRSARKLAIALRDALQTAGFGDDEPTLDALLPFLGRGGLFAKAARREASGQAAVMNAFRGIYFLRQDALKLMEALAKRKAMKPVAKGNSPQRAMKILVAGLAGVYFDVWETLPAFSRGAGKSATGPFIRLMVEVTNALRGRGLVFAATAESLAKHWRELPADERLRIDVAAKASGHN